jgi:tetratricopeptide (TPR) repeat protein
MRTIKKLASGVLRTLCVGAAFAAAGAGAQNPGAESALRRGNAEFRAGNFESALGYYSDALIFAEDSSLVFFNIGASHYRLGQYDEAARAFEAAAANPRLEAVAHYNLGLVARQQGNSAAARGWFVRARDESTNAALSQRAAAAIAEIDGRDAETIVPLTGGFSTRVAARVGFDSNPFRSPSSGYIDISQSTAPAIDPISESGFYIPLRVDVDYYRPMAEDRALVGTYTLRSDKYLDSVLSSADRTVHRLAFGGELPLGASRGNHRLTALGVYRKHDETNFDPDDGLVRNSAGQSIADRYDYSSTGIESALDGGLGQMSYELNLRIENRDYKDTLAVTQYDHDYSSIDGEISYPLSVDAAVSANYLRYRRDYAERHARDLTGSAVATNPTLEYVYDEWRFNLNYRFSGNLRAQLRYSRTDRSDQFVGYNDYSEDGIRLFLSQRFNDRLRAQYSVEFVDRSYPRAFAFDEPGAAPKAYDFVAVRGLLEYELSNQLSLYGELDALNVDSSDPRGAYDRLRTSIGVNWTCCDRN